MLKKHEYYVYIIVKLVYIIVKLGITFITLMRVSFSDAHIYVRELMQCYLTYHKQDKLVARVGELCYTKLITMPITMLISMPITMLISMLISMLAGTVRGLPRQRAAAARRESRGSPRNSDHQRRASRKKQL